MNPISAFKQTISGLLASPDSVDAKKHATSTMKNHQFVTQTSRRELAIKLTVTIILGMLTFGVVSIILIAKDIRDMIKADDDIEKSEKIVDAIVNKLQKAEVKNNSITIKLDNNNYTLENDNSELVLRQDSKIVHRFKNYTFENFLTKNFCTYDDDIPPISDDEDSDGSDGYNDLSLEEDENYIEPDRRFLSRSDEDSIDESTDYSDEG